MSVIEIAERRRERTFERVAQAAVEDGYAVGSPDETGWPRVRASVHLVAECGTCGLNLPEDHTCNQESSNG